MPRKSSITQLPKEARELLDKLIREGRYTIDELQARVVAKLREIGEEDDVSRSAVGRYRKSAEQQMQRYREAQEVAKVWASKIGEEPEGDVGKLLIEMLRSLAFKTIGDFGDADKIKAGDLMFIAKAIKDVTSADKIIVEREVKIRNEVLKEAEARVVGAAKEAGTSDEAIAIFRKALKGEA